MFVRFGLIGKALVMKKLLLMSVFCVLALPLNAQESRYSSWSDPNKPQTSDSSLNQMVDELRDLVREAEKARAADPQFLKDLNQLADRYGQPVYRLLFQDDFSDGNYTHNPVWTVSSGKYWIEQGYGLRSAVEAATATQDQPQEQSRKVSKEELLIGVLGAVLGAKNQNTQSQEPVEKQAPAPAQAARIYTQQAIKNSFRIEMDFSSWAAGGNWAFGPYQGSNRDTGYRLVYQPDQSPALQLMRHYTKSSAVVASHQTLKLEDSKNHKLVWQRSPDGQMQVILDGETLMNVTDQSFRDDFSGFVLTNSAGDFTVKSLSVYGQ